MVLGRRMALEMMILEMATSIEVLDAGLGMAADETLGMVLVGQTHGLLPLVRWGPTRRDHGNACRVMMFGGVQFSSPRLAGSRCPHIARSVVFVFLQFLLFLLLLSGSAQWMELKLAPPRWRVLSPRSGLARTVTHWR